MAINRDKPQLWKADIERSIDHYNDWFLRFAPEAYRTQRALKTSTVLSAFVKTAQLCEITPQLLLDAPGVLPILRMATSPPIARDRLSGLAYVSKSLIYTMEGSDEKPPRLPTRMKKTEAVESLTRMCEVITELLDHDLFPWIGAQRTPAADELTRAAAVVADRLTGAAADPLIRNAQEQRQLSALQTWLQRRHYAFVKSDVARNLAEMPAGTYTFHLNLTVHQGAEAINIPIDCVIKPHDADDSTIPIFIEAKSAGDGTNTNKRRKEEAQKFSQLRAHFGRVTYILLLGGYFDPGYLGYEAAEGFDWIWEHRIDDLDQLLKSPEGEAIRKIGETQVAYLATAQSTETIRFELQRTVDAMKSAESRNRAGQYSTPFALARQIVENALGFLPPTMPIAFLEPALGAGVFYSALIASINEHAVADAVGVELDADYARVAQQIWGDGSTRIVCDDFLEFAREPENSSRFNLLCTNPPYVRHHHMTAGRKVELQARVKELLGLTVSGLSGLYVYFILLADSVLADDAIASWLVPSEFLVVNYGKALRDYLTQRVTLLRLHQFNADDVQFDDALVSSCIVTYQKRRPSAGHRVQFTSGTDMGTPTSARILGVMDPILAGRWSFFVHPEADQVQPDASTLRLGDLFDIKRGIATGANDFFIVDRDKAVQHKLPWQFLKPILPSPRLLHEPIIQGDRDGIPTVKPQLFLLACDLAPDTLKQEHPTLWRYFQSGVEQAVSTRYLCNSRDVWYFQERRLPSKFLASYMGRSNHGTKNPIRFFLNRSNALVTNVYLHLYPKPNLAALLAENDEREIDLLDMLNGIPITDVLHAGRSYGGGLHKIEPKELAVVPILMPPEWLRRFGFKQLSFALFETRSS